jgi:hypothetical protein
MEKIRIRDKYIRSANTAYRVPYFLAFNPDYFLLKVWLLPFQVHDVEDDRFRQLIVRTLGINLWPDTRTSGKKLFYILMRSSRVVRASDSQCRCRNCPGFDPSILRRSGISGAEDEAVLNIVHKKEKIPLFYILYVLHKSSCPII